MVDDGYLSCVQRWGNEGATGSYGIQNDSEVLAGCCIVIQGLLERQENISDSPTMTPKSKLGSNGDNR